MAVAEFHNNGDRQAYYEPDVLKILVIGEQRCGKSSFIRTFAKDNLSGEITTDTGSIVYPYEYYHFGVLRKYVFIEVPGVNQEGMDRAIYSHTTAKGFILMYAIDDPASLHLLKNKWHPKLDYFHSHKRIPMIAVGMKADQRENQGVIARLALLNQTPVTTEEGQSLTELPQVLRYFECSNEDLPRVNDACTFILREAYENANPSA